MSLYNTPPQNVREQQVTKTNKRTRPQRQRVQTAFFGHPIPLNLEDEQPPMNLGTNVVESDNKSDIKSDVEGSVKNLNSAVYTARGDAEPFDSKRSVKSGMSSKASSCEARRKRLEYEAAQQKARIQMQLIDSKLAADLADLEEYSSQSKSDQRSDIKRWIEQSQQELELGLDVNEMENLPDMQSSPAQAAGTIGQASQAPLPPPPVKTGTDDTYQPPLSRPPPLVQYTSTGNDPPLSSLVPQASTNEKPSPPSPPPSQPPPPPPMHPVVSNDKLVAQLAPESSTLSQTQQAVQSVGTNDGTMLQLAMAIKDLATATTSNNQNNLLSRMSTPKELPLFFGDPIEWLHFKQAYKESTEVCKFTEKENLWRLRKCLRGPAREAVSALLISATSPETVISALKLQFGNPEVIIYRIMQDIRKLQPMPLDYHKEIIPFSVKVKNFVAAVHAINQKEYLQNISVTSSLLSKLPTVLISKWTDYSFLLIREGKMTKLEILSQFLEEEAIKTSQTAEASGITPSPSNLLEWELSLPSEQIVSHAWYHGGMSRSAAEAQLHQDRQFLVRASSSQPDHYVLSCRSNGQHLHFVIQRIIVHPDTVYERYQFQFEDEAYDTVADLITSYVGSGKPISAASGATIQYPANRVAPLANYSAADVTTSSTLEKRGYYGNPHSLYSHIAAKPGFHMRMPFKKQRSHSLTPIDIIQSINHSKSASADGVIQAPNFYKFGKNMSYESNSSSGTWEANLPTSPPAKPARYDSSKADDRRLELQRLYQVSGSDSGNGSGDSTQSSAQGDPNKTRGDAVYSVVTPTIKQLFDYDMVEARLMQSDHYYYVVDSIIDLENYRSHIIRPGLTKPLESETLHTIKLLLRTSGPRILANHLTKIDLNLLLHTTVHIDALEQKVTVLELCFLPQGRQLRLDLIERVETFRLLVAVTILTCQTNRQRADTINDWIQLAIETKTALGNLYGFSAIMHGLCMSQVECLDNAWNILRRVYTDNAFMFESKLRPSFKSMNEGTNPVPPNTTTPHILAPVLCFQAFDVQLNDMQQEASFQGSLFNTLEFDFHATAAHLDAAQHYPEQIEMFKRNSRTVVQEISSLGPTLDPILLELFKTEFHINFLWGEKGALTIPNQRFARLTDILTTMAQKLVKLDEDVPH